MPCVVLRDALGLGLGDGLWSWFAMPVCGLGLGDALCVGFEQSSVSFGLSSGVLEGW